MTDVLETSDDGRLRVILEPDTDCECPMGATDGWVTSILARNGRNLDWAPGHDPGDRLGALEFFWDRDWGTAVDHFARWMRIFHDIEVQHVEIVNGYRDTSTGVAWVEPSELTRIGYEPTHGASPTWAPAHDLVTNEIAEHNRWAEGDCWGYRVQKLTTWREVSEDPFDTELATRETWEDTESCWGFIGREYAEQEAREALTAATTD